MNEEQLYMLANTAVSRMIPDGKKLDIEFYFRAVPNRDHVYYRQMIIGVKGTNLRKIYNLDDLYAPPKTLDVLLLMELEAQIRLHVPDFLRSIKRVHRDQLQ